MAEEAVGRLIWDKDGERTYETGTDRGVLYRMNAAGTAYETGVAWNGLTAVNASPSGAEETALWADNIKYLSIRSAEEFGGSIGAYTYPPEFGECDGSKALVAGRLFIGQQARRKFAFSYRSLVGNDTLGNAYGEKIHIVYGCSVSPSERAYATVNDSPEAVDFSWEFTTQASTFTVDGETFTTSELTIDLTGATEAQKKAIYNKLWGTDADSDNNVTASAPTCMTIGTMAAFIKSVFEPEEGEEEGDENGNGDNLGGES